MQHRHGGADALHPLTGETRGFNDNFLTLGTEDFHSRHRQGVKPPLKLQSQENKDYHVVQVECTPRFACCLTYSQPKWLLGTTIQLVVDYKVVLFTHKLGAAY